MRKFYLWFAAIAVVTYLGATFMHAAYVDAQPGNVGEPTAWKLRVTVETDKGTPVDVLVMTIKGTSQTRTWPSKDVCIEFESSDEFKASLGPLAAVLIGQGNDPEHTTVTFTCVPDPKAESF